MGDPQDVKGKGQYHSWSVPEHRLLLRSLVDAINHGFRDASGKFNKLTVETRILSVLRQQLGSKKTYSQYKNRMKILRTRYQTLSDFLRCNSGFGWDSETNKFTADDEVWKVYLKAHPGNDHLRNNSFEDFEELRMVFEQNTATGQNAMGLGDPVDALNSQIEDGERPNDIDGVDIMNDGERIVHREAYEHGASSSAEKNLGEKLPLRKKARTDSHLDKALEEVTEISSQIFGMIQKRWEKEAEEKVAEEKANNVWDAIKQIPDMEDDLRYEAMTLVHSLGMKSGFIKMSIADRCGWIKQNLRKP